MNGKQVLIVGGSAGIGLRLAHTLSDLGANVIIASRSADQLGESFNQPVRLERLDASCEASVSALFEALPTLDAIISTIKPSHVQGSFTDLHVEDARRAFDAKFWGQYYLAKYGATKVAKDGCIILTSGIAAVKAYSGFASTAAINGAIESLVRSLALELSPIRVNAVSPGFVERFSNDAERLASVAKLTTARLPLGRLACHQDIADAYVYLLNSRYTTGTVLTVDGGSTL